MEEIKRQELLFDLNQSKPRALIRIKEGRAGPQDVMIANLYACLDPMYKYELNSMGFKISENINVSRLSLQQLEQILQDLEYLKLDESTIDFWEKMGILVGKEVEKRSMFARSNNGILKDLEIMISNKSLDDLKNLQEEIILKIKSGGMIDFDYWEMALKFLQVVLAEKEFQQVYERFWKVCIGHDEESTLTSLIYPVTQYRKLKPICGTEEVEDKLPQSNIKNSNHWIQRFKVIPKEYKHLQIVKEHEFKIMLENMINQNSLTYIHPKLEGEGGIVERKDKSELEEKREKLFHRDSGLEITPEETAFKKEEVFLPCSPNIDITHRLRKPRYHNSIKTVVEWNKYNSTHYNEFNPPPKVVDGYKFNLYYPDLLDKSKPPNYQISPDITEETRILRFTAGKPYADIAFRIVNKPWDVCHRRGFRVDFENGHLRLYFGFKKDPFSQI